jgi:hypothetical protein
MRISLFHPAAVAAVCVLGGCTVFQPPAKSHHARAKPAPVETKNAPAAQSDQQMASVEPTGPRPGIKPPLNVPPVDPHTIVGKSQDQMVAMLGQPTAIQNSPPATIWQYRTDSCVLDVLFYMDMGTNSLRALDYDARFPDAPANDELIGRCMGIVQVTNRASDR